MARSITRNLVVTGLLLLTQSAISLAQTQQTPAQTNDPLLKLLITKGLLTNEDAESVVSAGDVTKQRQRLAMLLRDKGVISAAEFEALQPATVAALNTAPATGERVAAAVAP